MTRLRVLGAIRLSRKTDESTSPVRQRGRIDWWTGGNKADLIDVAEDLDVSGKISPFERDGLGPWLTDEKAAEWDVLVAWKLDRISRSAMDTLKLLQWCEERGKRIVCVDDGLDSTTRMGKVWIQLAAIFAEVERGFIEDRNAGGRDELRAQGRFPGGQVPWGLMPVRNPDGDGWKLGPHPERAPIVVKMARYVAGEERLPTKYRLSWQNRKHGESYESVARWLNDEKVPSPRGGKYGWSGVAVQRILESPTIRWGLAVHDGRPIEGVEYAEALLTPELAWRLEKEMDRRGRENKGRGPTKFLTQIVFCGACDYPMYYSGQTAKKTGKLYEYYRCTSASAYDTDCQHHRIPASVLETYVEREFLARVGSEEMFERVEVPGSTHVPELNAVKSRITKLAAMFASGVLDESDTDFVNSLAVLKKKRAELEKLPVVEATEMLVPTGVHYFDVWEEGNNETRREAMLDRGVRITVQPPIREVDTAVELIAELEDADAYMDLKPDERMHILRCSFEMEDQDDTTGADNGEIAA